MFLEEVGLIMVLLLGLGSWIIPLYSLAKKDFSSSRLSVSLGMAFLSLSILFLQVIQWISQGDWATLLDTYAALRTCAIILISGVLAFNTFFWISSKKQKNKSVSLSNWLKNHHFINRAVVCCLVRHYFVFKFTIAL